MTRVSRSPPFQIGRLATLSSATIRRGGMRKQASGPVPDDLELVKKQVEALKAAGKALQKCQASLPLPAPEEMAHIKKVQKTLTPETYRIGVYQRVMMAIE